MQRCAESTIRKWTSPAGAGLPLLWNWTRNSGNCLPFHHGFLRRLIEVNLAVHIIDPIDRNEMMMAAGFRIILGQHDTVTTFFMVDGSDMFTVRSLDQCATEPESQPGWVDRPLHSKSVARRGQRK